MENKHTPEWYISKMKSPVYGSDGSLVDERYGIGSGPSTFIGSVKKLEHARLIAAAPEMLEALKEILADQSRRKVNASY
jgi:hypothetical protein